MLEEKKAKYEKEQSIDIISEHSIFGSMKK